MSHSYRGKNYDRIYKQANRSIIHSSKDSPDPKVLKACLSKVGYDTSFEADVAAAKRRMYTYKCSFCPHYHLTRRKQ